MQNKRTKFLLPLLLIFIALSSQAQIQYATTEKGRKVILRNNGTWEYVADSSEVNNVYYANRIKSVPSNSYSANTKSTRTTAAGKRPTASAAKTSTRRSYIRGPRGGCYYINRNGGKTYVDRSLCN